ncbi:MAG: F0F1 ATP synthase subunit epsilon [Actinomycetota bacterium]|nr:F0F1 ATP synthase subunit epsilon [Actinomycetota bacterium]
MVIARTTEGELGVLPGHAPLLGELAEGWVVRIQQDGGEEIVAAVHGGFLSVTDEGVSILAETAELAEDVDVARARQALEGTSGADRDDDDAQAARSRAMGRLRAAGESV